MGRMKRAGAVVLVLAVAAQSTFGAICLLRCHAPKAGAEAGACHHSHGGSDQPSARVGAMPGACGHQHTDDGERATLTGAHRPIHQPLAHSAGDGSILTGSLTARPIVVFRASPSDPSGTLHATALPLRV